MDSFSFFFILPPLPFFFLGNSALSSFFCRLSLERLGWVGLDWVRLGWIGPGVIPVKHGFVFAVFNGGIFLTVLEEIFVG